MPEPRSYHQNCSLALALDLLGERWTLLIVRELARGPKRFTDLEAGLPGVGTNLLAARMRRLVDREVAARVQLTPGVPAYGLTEAGEGLASALEPLALWGMTLLRTPDDHSETRAAWAAMNLQATINRDPDPALDGTYAFEVDGEAFWLRVAEGRAQLRDGVPPYAPEARLVTDRAGFFAAAGAQAGWPAADVAGDAPLLRALGERFELPGGLKSPEPRA